MLKKWWRKRDTDSKARWLCFFGFLAIASFLYIAAFVVCISGIDWTWIQRQAIDFFLMCWFLICALWKFAVGIFIGALAYELWLTKDF